ncbi:FkbM family methyltransferase [Oricola sp.]|uniref:FkbM family methyltransferase n=1 Tax=Oricola sp. TaxID=1979950 RepID=UPI003BAD30E9
MVETGANIAAFGARRPSLLARTVWPLINNRRLSQRVRKRLRRSVGEAFAGPYDISVAGIAFRVYPLDNYCDRTLISRHRFPEPDEHRMLEAWLPQGGVFVDIGANVGTYTLFAAQKLGPGGRVIAFEPHPVTYAKLRFNIEANGADSVTALNCGCGLAAETMTLWSDGGNNIGSATLVRAASSNPKVATEIRLDRLPDMLAAHGIARVDALKIDVEGFEDEALLPLFDDAYEHLWPTAVLIEVAHRTVWRTDIVAHLSERGYRTNDKTGENLLLVRD